MDYLLNLDWDDFIKHYWQKRPVVLKNVFKNFIDPISPDELAGLAMENEVDSRLVSQTNGHWQTSNGPFENYDHLGDKDWSLLVQAVNHWHAPSAALIKPFRKLPDWRFDDLMISFSVPGGGVGPHIDNYGVFIVQGMGSRRWRVGDINKSLKQYYPHRALLHVEPFEPIIDEDLENGDILYIPPGFPHDGFTHETAINYSIGFRAPNGRDLISGFADYVLEQDLGDEHYSDPDLKLREHPAEVQLDELEHLRTMMTDLINQPEDFNQWFGRFITLSRHELDLAPADPPYRSDEIYDALVQGDKLIRLSGLRVLRVADNCYANGELIDTDFIHAADGMCRHLLIGQEELGDALEDPAFVAILTHFVNNGYWYFND